MTYAGELVNINMTLFTLEVISLANTRHST
jgi:hypothetical protein